MKRFIAAAVLTTAVSITAMAAASPAEAATKTSHSTASPQIWVEVGEYDSEQECEVNGNIYLEEHGGKAYSCDYEPRYKDWSLHILID